MSPPANKKGIQWLVCWIAVVSQFISHFSDQCRFIFNMLWGSNKFQWTHECQKAFQKLIEYLLSSPLLKKPNPIEIIYLNLSVSETTINSALVLEEGQKNFLVYHRSKVFLDTKTRYIRLGHFALALIEIVKNLKHYLQSNIIVVMICYPLTTVLHNLDSSGRLKKWYFGLGEYDI